jgi:hypothetical protein
MASDLRIIGRFSTVCVDPIVKVDGPVEERIFAFGQRNSDEAFLADGRPYDRDISDTGGLSVGSRRSFYSLAVADDPGRGIG